MELSDETKIAGTTWSEIKDDAMKDDFMSTSFYVSAFLLVQVFPHCFTN